MKIGGAYEDRGSKRSPYLSNKAPKTWQKPHFRGLAMARWPQPRGYTSLVP